MEPTFVPLQPKTKPRFFLLALVLIFLSLGTTGFFIFQNLQLRKQITLPQSSPISSPAPVLSSHRQLSQYSKNVFPIVEDNLLQLEQDILLSPSKDFTLISSFLSPDKTKIVFSEVSDCFNPVYVSCSENANYNPGLSCDDCQAVYRLAVKDLSSETVSVLYEYPKNGSSSNLAELIIKPVYAGAIVNHVLFPFAWSLDSQFLFAKDGVFQSMPVGGLSPRFYSINLKNGKIIPLGFSDELLTDSDFSKAVKSETDLTNFPYINYCYGGISSWTNKLMSLNLYDGSLTPILEGDIYYPKEIDQGVLKYYSLTVEEANQIYNDNGDFFCSNPGKEFEEKAILLP